MSDDDTQTSHEQGQEEPQPIPQPDPLNDPQIQQEIVESDDYVQKGLKDPAVEHRDNE